MVFVIFFGITRDISLIIVYYKLFTNYFYYKWFTAEPVGVSSMTLRLGCFTSSHRAAPYFLCWHGSQTDRFGTGPATRESVPGWVKYPYLEMCPTRCRETHLLSCVNPWWGMGSTIRKRAFLYIPTKRGGRWLDELSTIRLNQCYWK